jgi:hypothetical protein
MSIYYISPYQIHFIIPFVLITLFGASLCCLAWFNRKTYPPFAAKQLEPILLSLLSATFSGIGRLFTFGVFGYEGIFHQCQIWKYICQCSLGIHLYLSILTFRHQRLYYTIILKKERAGFAFWFPVVGLSSLAFVWSILPYFIRFDINNLQLTLDGMILPCIDENHYYGMTMYGLVFLQILVIIYLNIKLIKIRKAINEVRVDVSSYFS